LRQIDMGGKQARQSGSGRDLGRASGAGGRVARARCEPVARPWRASRQRTACEVAPGVDL